MLKSLKLRNFTVFSKADLHFADGLNVVVGENGSGKSHLLKIAYTVASLFASGERDSGTKIPSKGYLESAIAKKLLGVFRPAALGSLARHQVAHSLCEVEAELTKKPFRLGFSFDESSKAEVVVDHCPTKWEGKPPVFLPTQELLSIFPGFAALYEPTELPFEEAWRDTCLLLAAPLAKGARLNGMKRLLKPLEEQLGGQIDLDGGRFYIRTQSGKIEAHLMAEGHRKLAMLAMLIATGSLTETGSLFWDEPEANLNPKAIKSIAPTILQLCRSGIQVFVASHSLFLLRELDILSKADEYKNIPCQFIGLHPTDEGVEIQQGDSVDDIGIIDALQEELSQSDRYLKAEMPA